ncbi:mitochondrial genome maintenance exonuclease 1-like [Antedon mediterranea]|uniref:mitochondrial genome maintenance exonuclease 1-like n=1 Tax=Antedon mediterranea TaxID=105859 RepID=UPI003AF7A4FB
MASSVQLYSNHVRSCLLLRSQIRASSSSRTVLQPRHNKERKKPTTSQNASDLKENFQFHNLSDFHTSKDDGVDADGLAVSRHGNSIFFPLVKKDKQDFTKCVQKSDSASASVSKVLKETMPPERLLILKRWENKMIKELGIEGFESYKKEIFETGSTFHQYLQDYLISGKSPDDIPESLLGYWTSIKSVIPHVSDIGLNEEPVRHPYLNYHGIVDCVASFRNHLCVIEWKTSRKRKSSLKQTYDYPLQTAAYAGAINFTKETQHQINNIAIVIAYENGDQSDVHFLNRDLTNLYWTQWLQRLQEYKQSLKTVSEE